MSDIRNHSLWWDNLPAGLKKLDRPVLSNDLDVDVVIVGAGYTGLWTAYYLAKQNPDLEIVILDANFVGFGASGRNGGWCSALFPTSIDKLGRKYGAEQAKAMQNTMHQTVIEVEQVVKTEHIDCDWQRGGSLVFARSQLQQDRAQAEIANWHSWGFGPADYSYLNPAELKEKALVTNNFGATYTKHVAAIHPAKLVRSLAKVVEHSGVKIYEMSPAVRIDPGMVTTEHAVIRAKYVVRATEGYTATLPETKRALAPIYSLMLATEPLSADVWDQIGLANRQTFSDGRNLIIYGQRTSDNRIAFGGRGAPYHFGSKIESSFDLDKTVHSELEKILVELFPVLKGKTITHKWGGPLGVPRDWMASVGLDKNTGLAWAGGYVGDGVGTSNLAGRTLADLIMRKQTELTKLPWVNHRSPNWEPEPLRWLGANLGLQAMTIADRTETKTGRTSMFPKLVGYFTGH